MKTPPLALLSLLLSAQALANCTKQEYARLDQISDLGLRPFTTLSSDPMVSDKCKRELLFLFSVNMSFVTDGGLCPGDRCTNYAAAMKAIDHLTAAKGQRFCASGPLCAPGQAADCSACALDPAVESVVRQADDLLSRALQSELDLIQAKIKEGRVPNCLLPNCKGGDCRPALVKLWWEDYTSPKGAGEKEVWIKRGGFTHLVVASAFTCPTAKQKGGTCAIYSGASLMAHYCATPRYNPSAAAECSDRGPGFSCVPPGELLREVHEAGGWSAQLCVQDDKKGSSACGPAIDNKKEDAEDKAKAKAEAGCAANPAGKGCRALQRSLEALRLQAGAQALEAASVPKARHSKVWVSGRPGTFLSSLAAVYRKHGFETISYDGDAAGWAKALEAVRAGHPLQIDVDPKDFSGYGGKSSGHAIVLEGAWKDGKGIERVLLGDSNDPDSIKVLTEPEAQAAYTKRGLGSIDLCPPTDPERGRCRAMSAP